MQFLQRVLLSGGVILMASAVVSKILGFYRDRLLLDIFGAEKVDLIFGALRIPDFFFYLLVASSVSVLFIPKFEGLSGETGTHNKSTPPASPRGQRDTNSSISDNQNSFVSSFFWLLGIGFGVISLLGIFCGNFLVDFFLPGFSDMQKSEILAILPWLWGGVFCLGVSALFTAFLQTRGKFFWMALAPIFYTGGIVMGILFLEFFITTTIGDAQTGQAQDLPLQIIGSIFLAGGFLHLVWQALGFFVFGGKISWAFLRPISAWKNFPQDFGSRVLTGSAYQINQSVDIMIASLLMAGSVTAFTLGTNLGHVLLSVVGIPIAQWIFPKMSKTEDFSAKFFHLKRGLKFIFLVTVPAVIFGIFFGKFLLEMLFGLEGRVLDDTFVVFLVTVLTLPMACAIPILSRFFLSFNDSRTPLWITSVSLLVATSLAAILSLVILPEKSAIWGLAIGNGVANFLSFVGFVIMVWRKC